MAQIIKLILFALIDYRVRRGFGLFLFLYVFVYKQPNEHTLQFCQAIDFYSIGGS